MDRQPTGKRVRVCSPGWAAHSSASEGALVTLGKVEGLVASGFSDAVLYGHFYCDIGTRYGEPVAFIYIYLLLTAHCNNKYIKSHFTHSFHRPPSPLALRASL
jgi:hypothetical protein